MQKALLATRQHFFGLGIGKPVILRNLYRGHWNRKLTLSGKFQDW
jgi:hypothetical protein